MKESSKSDYGSTNESEIKRLLISKILQEKGSLLASTAAKELGSRMDYRQAVYDYANTDLTRRSISQLERLDDSRNIQNAFKRFLRSYRKR